VHRTATISIFLSVPKCGPICTAQSCAHSSIEPSRSAKGFLQGGPKSSKKNDFFTISRQYVHMSQKLLKIEAYKQRTEKKLYHSPVQQLIFLIVSLPLSVIVLRQWQIEF